MNLTQKEKNWIEEHGCIHAMYPDVEPIFCPVCKPDPSDIWKKVSKRYNDLLEGDNSE